MSFQRPLPRVSVGEGKPSGGGSPGWCWPRPASAGPKPDPCVFKTSQERTQLPRVTTHGRPWKMRRSSSRSTLRGQRGFSETDLKLEMVSNVQSELDYLDQAGGFEERRVLAERPWPSSGCSRPACSFGVPQGGHFLGLWVVIRHQESPAGPAGSGTLDREAPLDPGRFAGPGPERFDDAAGSGPVTPSGSRGLSCGSQFGV